MHLEEIIQTIKRRRAELEVTQELLAELSGVGLRTLKGLEAGKGNPTLETLLKIIDVLGLELKLEVKPLK
jgi:transcriptional regulator with XRE-family HTH domain